MDIIIQIEFYYFKMCLFYGFMITMSYDLLRILRRLFKHKDIFVAIEDIVYGLFIGIQIFILNYENNNGVVRIFMFVGLLIGSICYHKIFSTTFVTFFSRILKVFVDKSKEMLIIFAKFPKNVNKLWKVPKKIRKN